MVNDEIAGEPPNMNIKITAYAMAYLHYNTSVFSKLICPYW